MVWISGWEVRFENSLVFFFLGELDYRYFKRLKLVIESEVKSVIFSPYASLPSS